MNILYEHANLLSYFCLHKLKFVATFHIIILCFKSHCAVHLVFICRILAQGFSLVEKLSRSMLMQIPPSGGFATDFDYLPFLSAARIPLIRQSLCDCHLPLQGEGILFRHYEP